MSPGICAARLERIQDPLLCFQHPSSRCIHPSGRGDTSFWLFRGQIDLRVIQKSCLSPDALKTKQWWAITGLQSDSASSHPTVLCRELLRWNVVLTLCSPLSCLCLQTLLIQPGLWSSSSLGAWWKLNRPAGWALGTTASPQQHRYAPWLRNHVSHRSPGPSL